MFTKVVLGAVLAAALSGCAAQSYGRLQSVTLDEANELDCASIAAELVRIEGFRQVVGRGPAWWDASARVADAAAGNDQERQAARHSAEARRAQLLEVSAKRGCDGSLARLAHERI